MVTPTHIPWCTPAQCLPARITLSQEADAEDERQRQLLASQKLALLNRMAGKDKAPCKVAHRLYIGPIGAARNLKALRKAGITHILNATAVVPCFFRERPVGAFSYLHVPIFDEASTELLPHLEEANAFVAAGRRAGGVLVHCYAGQSRSAAFVIAHLVAHEGADLLTAWSTVRKARPCAAPNAGFMKQLALYARSLGRDSGPLPLDDEE